MKSTKRSAHTPWHCSLAVIHPKCISLIALAVKRLATAVVASPSRVLFGRYQNLFVLQYDRQHFWIKLPLRRSLLPNVHKSTDPLNAKLNPIWHLLAPLESHHILHHISPYSPSTVPGQGAKPPGTKFKKWGGGAVAPKWAPKSKKSRQN